MEDKNFYTIEGQRYFLKTVNNYTPLSTFGSGFVLPTVRINNGPASAPWVIALTTTKKIIPVICSLAVGDGLTPVNIDVTSVYYTSQLGSGLNDLSGMSCLSKMVALTDKVSFDSNAFYQFNVKYNDAVFSNFDFIDTTAGITLQFIPNVGGAYLINNQLQSINLPVFDYQANVVFTYFELE